MTKDKKDTKTGFDVRNQANQAEEDLSWLDQLGDMNPGDLMQGIDKESIGRFLASYSPDRSPASAASAPAFTSDAKRPRHEMRYYEELSDDSKILLDLFNKILSDEYNHKDDYFNDRDLSINVEKLYSKFRDFEKTSQFQVLLDFLNYLIEDPDNAKGLDEYKKLFERLLKQKSYRINEFRDLFMPLLQISDIIKKCHNKDFEGFRGDLRKYFDENSKKVMTYPWSFRFVINYISIQKEELKQNLVKVLEEVMKEREYPLGKEIKKALGVYDEVKEAKEVGEFFTKYRDLREVENIAIRIQRNFRGSKHRGDFKERFEFDIDATEEVQFTTTEFEERILKTAEKSRFIDSIKHYGDMSFLRQILDDGLYGRENLYKMGKDFRPSALADIDMRNGDSNAICFAYKEVDGNSVQEGSFVIELDIEKIRAEGNDSAFYKVRDMGLSDHDFFSVDIGKGLKLNFMWSGQADIGMVGQCKIGFSCCTSEIPENFRHESEYCLISYLPASMIINKDVGNMESFFIKSFFYALYNSNLNDDGGLDSEDESNGGLDSEDESNVKVKSMAKKSTSEIMRYDFNNGINNIDEMHRIIKKYGNEYNFKLSDEEGESEEQITKEKIANDFIEGFERHLLSLRDEELKKVLENIIKAYVSTMEFNFYGAHLVNMNFVKSIAQCDKEGDKYRLEIDEFLSDLNKGKIKKYKEAVAEMPQLFQSHRFLDFLIFKTHEKAQQDKNVNSIREDLIEKIRNTEKPLWIQYYHEARERKLQEAAIPSGAAIHPTAERGGKIKIERE